MDMSQFKKEFIDEALKQSAVINSALLNLNKKSLTGSLTEISRAAHILKSSAAAMGYKQISNLSKAMEETINNIIDKKIEINTAIRDVLTECAGALKVLIEEVFNNKKESNVSGLINKLKSIK